MKVNINGVWKDDVDDTINSSAVSGYKVVGIGQCGNPTYISVPQGGITYQIYNGNFVVAYTHSTTATTYGGFYIQLVPI